MAIIPDGNRRWAKEKGLPTLVGHKKGFDRAVELVRESRKMGIHTLTLWAFSTENWNRTKDEIGYLMKLYEQMIERTVAEAHEWQARMIHLGRKDRIPKNLAEKIAKAEDDTRGYTKHVLNIALDYGGHDEILRAIEKIRNSKLENRNLWNEIGQQGKYPIYKLAEYLDTGDQPYPYVDLMIRTSGEQRTSGLLLWQSAYTEYYFIKEHFPDFTPALLQKAVEDFDRRDRRFGGN